jgi:hypothetical protein
VSSAQSIRERSVRGDAFRRDEIVALMNIQDDLNLWSAIYRALDRSYAHIHPEPGMELTCGFMLKYLLRCIRENPSGHDEIHSGFEAAWELAACLKLWSQRLPETGEILTLAEELIRQEFLNGDEPLRNRLETGMLEHALEAPQVRPYFSHWANDPSLREAWQAAMEWATHHEDNDHRNWP